MIRHPLFTAFRVRPFRWTWTTTVPVLVMLLGALSGRAEAQATGDITGTVTDAGTGAPLAGVSVQVYKSNGTSAGSSVTTNASGVYVFPGLVTGTYYVRTSNILGYIDKLYNNIPCPASQTCTVTTGTGVAVTAGATAAGIDFALAAGATITGTVTDASTGAPLANVNVNVHNASGIGSTVTTNASGVYVRASLATGTYYVKTFNSLGYVDELYDNFSCEGGQCTVSRGTGVSVTAGSTASGVNFGLAIGGTISGTVTDAATGAPLANVSVKVYNISSSDSAVNTATAFTNASGVYTLRGLATGGHFLTASAAGYVDELYDDKPCLNLGCDKYRGTSVPVTAGAATNGIDFSLSRPGVITGTVTDAATGLPLANVTVRLFDARGEALSPYSNITTNASGVYSWTGLSTGSYLLETWNSLGYIDELYSDIPCPAGGCWSVTRTTGMPVNVTAGATTGGINFGLASGGTIAGTVTDAATGGAIAGAVVYVYHASGTSYVTATTNASGVYTRTGLPTGTYFVRTFNSLGYLDELYNDMPCPGGTCNATTGMGVGVTAGATTGNVDFALAAGGQITGTVTNAETGAPLASGSVRAYDANGTAVGNAAYLNTSGSYTLKGLPTGTYYIRTTNSLSFVDELYNDVACPGGRCALTTGIGVSVTNGAVTSGIDFALATGGTITGTVTDADTKAPLAGTLVYAYDAAGTFEGYANANGSGMYTLTGLATGTHRVLAYGTVGNYVTELYNDIPCPGAKCAITTGTGVSVTTGTATSGIDFALATAVAGTITGTVTDASTHAPLAGVSVRAYSASNTWLANTTSDAAGTYTLTGLPAGACYLRSSNTLNYVDELYAGVPCPFGACTVTTGAGVTVVQGQTISGIDFDLAPGGRITGTVVEAGSLQPLQSMRVDLYNASNALVTTGVAGPTGSYEITGLAAGTYYARTNGYEFGYVDQRYSGVPCAVPCVAVGGTPITVPAGGQASGIDFALVRGGRIAGVLTDAQTGAAVQTTPVRVFNANGDSVAVGRNVIGQYITGSGLPAGTYYVVTENASSYTGTGYVSYLNEVYGGQLFEDVACAPTRCGGVTTGTPVVVALGATTEGVNFVLDRGGRITGTITDAATSAPVTSVPVRIYNASGAYVATATSASTGIYTTGQGLPPGTYYAVAGEGSGYARQLYSGLPCPSVGCDVLTGAPIVVSGAATTAGVNFALSACPLVSLSPPILPIGWLDTPYATSMSVQGGTAPFRFSHSSGMLPPGLSLAAATGTIAGTPASADWYGFGVTVIDANGCSGVGSTAVHTLQFEGTISGVKFLDSNGNGARGAGEPGLEGWTIFLDTNGNGSADAGERTVVTDLSGAYVFTALAPGTYRVREVQHAGWAQTTTTPPDIVITAGSGTSGVDFGNMPPSPLLTWAAPSAITAGTPLGATQLNATADVAGTFVYSPPAGTMLGVGDGQTLSVTFTPTDILSYRVATKSVLIDVLPGAGPPVITGLAPGSGAIGSGVTVTGTGFTGATAVTFHGVTAAYTVASDTQITTTVPAAATTGPVRVTTAGGTATSAADFVVTNQRATRALPGCYVAGYGVTVSIDVGPAPAVVQYALEDTPPPGWTVGAISDGGTWAAPTGEVRWGPFPDATARVVTYVMTPPAGTTGVAAFGGVARFDGVEVPLGGTATLPRCEQHPADANSDFRMVIGEVTGYGAAWKKGNTWTVPPLPIPIGYVTRAGYLWRQGETYHREVGDCPVCWLPGWLPGLAVPLPWPDAPLSLDDIPTPGSGPWSGEASDIVRSPGALAPGAAGTAVRHSSSTYVPTAPMTVTIAVTPNADVQAWALEETVPAGWRLSAVSADGFWDEKAGVVRWGPFFDETPQTLRYTLTPPKDASGPQSLRGTASFDGEDVAVTGVRTIQRAPITRPGEPGR